MVTPRIPRVDLSDIEARMQALESDLRRLEGLVVASIPHGVRQLSVADVRAAIEADPYAVFCVLEPWDRRDSLGINWPIGTEIRADHWPRLTEFCGSLGLRVGIPLIQPGELARVTLRVAGTRRERAVEALATAEELARTAAAQVEAAQAEIMAEDIAAEQAANKAASDEQAAKASTEEKVA